MTKSHDSANEKSSRMAMPATSAEHVRVDAEADREPDGSHQQHHEHVANEVGQRAAGEHRGARHRQRPEPFDEPCCRSSARPMPVFTAPNVTVCDEDTRHQVVDVGNAGHLDRAAEHVA